MRAMMVLLNNTLLYLAEKIKQYRRANRRVCKISSFCDSGACPPWDGIAEWLIYRSQILSSGERKLLWIAAFPPKADRREDDIVITHPTIPYLKRGKNFAHYRDTAALI